MCLRPTSCAPTGRPSRVRPHGSVIAGCPVMLNGCVSRSVMLRTGSSTVPTVTVAAPSLTAGTGNVGQQQAVAAVQRGVDLARQHLAAAHAPARSPQPGCSGPSPVAAGRSACSRPAGSPAFARDRPRPPPARRARRSSRSPRYAESRHRRAPRPRGDSRSQARRIAPRRPGRAVSKKYGARDAEPKSAKLASLDAASGSTRRRASDAGCAASSTDRHSGPM